MDYLLTLTITPAITPVFTGSIAQSASRRYLIYSEADLRFFVPQGRHVAPMGLKFGTEFPSVQRLGYSTPKLKFLLRFDQNVEYKRPTGAYPLCDFQFAESVPRFRMR